MSDVTKVPLKDLAELKTELQVADSKEELSMKKDEAQHRKQQETFDEVPKLTKNDNWKGSPVRKHKDAHAQQQPGGAMKGK